MSEPIIKYRTGGWNKPIERVECTRETAAYVFFMRAPLFGKGPSKEARARKDEGGERYHASWEDARAHLVAEREQEIKDSQARITRLTAVIETKRKEIEVIKAWQLAEGT